MLAKLIVCCTLAMLAVTSAAQAGGDYYVRKVVSSTFGACQPGYADVERLGYYADVYGLQERLVVACMADAKIASWVILAGVLCMGENDDQAVLDRCFDESGPRGVPLLFQEQGFDDASRPPFRLDYSLIRYAAGKDCRIVEVPQPHIYDPATGWDCKVVAFIDGTRDAQGRLIADPSQFRVRKYHSKAAVPFEIQSTDDDAPLSLPVTLAGHTYEQDVFDLLPYAK